MIRPFLLLITALFVSFLKVTAAEIDTLLHFPFNEASGTPYITEEVNNISFPLQNIFDFPERIPAVQGSALRLDGYSTYAEKDYAITGINNQMTIEAWYATEAFPPSTDADRKPIEGGAIISQINNESGFALEVGPYGNISLDFFADGQKYEVSTPQSIEKYVWNHIVATIDLSAQQAKIFVNGKLWKTASLAAHNVINLANAPMYIGRHNATALFSDFNLTTLNGALDDLKVYNVALRAEEVSERYTAFAPPAVTETLFEDFEGTDYAPWTIAGAAFGTQPAAGAIGGQHPVTGYRDNRLANSFHDGDVSQGTLRSPAFTIEQDLINFLIGGGNHPGKTEIRLLVDGKVVRSATGKNSETLVAESWNVGEFLGATAHIEIVDSVSGGWGHILADHITFSNQQELLEADLFIDPAIRHAGDELRPQFHAMPNTSWTNEPYGLIYYKGKYHLFFQKNPSGPYLFFMHWGHLSSPDLVHWQEEKVVMGPSPGFDDFGTWSGTTIMGPNNEPVIVYTGVDEAKAGIGLAYPQDEELIEWEKYQGNPVIASSPSGYLDFRDPFIWKDKDTYYMIVGAGLANNGGGALPTYKSQDLINWTRINTLFSNSDLEESGFFWEMPLFYPLNDQGDYILAVTPLYNGKPANVVYWTGKWENEKFTPYFDAPKILDASINNTLAPAIGRDAEGRITYIGIIPETRNVADQIEAGWRHAFSLPRVIRILEDSTIGQYPHPNLCRLRTNEVVVNDRLIEKGSGGNLPEFGGNQLNLSFSLQADSASRFSLQLLKSVDGSQFTSFIFDLEKNLVALDTRYAHEQAAQEEYTASEYVFDFTEKIDVEVFVDHSIVEVFIDNLLVLSTRAYPAETSKQVDLVVTQGAVKLLEAKQWTMKPMGSATGTTVCEPDFLPTAFRTVQEDSPVTGVKKNDKLRASIKLYPNPAQDVLNLEIPSQEEVEVAVLSMNGRVIKAEKVRSSKHQIQTAGLPEGLYLIRVKGRTFSEYFKIIIQVK
ncbi:LamG-like jellyroll fold domain-containing protein [Nafulsella turpanensis]|uniref:LamG-like jellyroll fold domain-containing protein n=1 Tax=Nafulsella turpanensis TaxID=1265690 RepID=UPI000364D50F|nr:LamG-like jellyroll fold domain-containing protein [Nafulsella turpanensis]